MSVRPGIGVVVMILPNQDYVLRVGDVWLHSQNDSQLLRCPDGAVVLLTAFTESFKIQRGMTRVLAKLLYCSVTTFIINRGKMLFL